MKKFIALTLALFLYTVSTLNSNVVNQFWVPSVYNGDGQFEHPEKRAPLLDPIQLDCMAKNIYFEASTQNEYGKFAVANATLNRVRDPYFPNSICGVIFPGPRTKNQPKLCQFSWFCDGKPDRIRNKKIYKECQRIAMLALLHRDRDITNGATHYHATYVRPWWAKRLIKTVQIGDHIFYRM